MTAERLLITGTTGFIGRRLIRAAAKQGYAVQPVSRSRGDADGVVVGDIGPRTDWSGALKGIAVVVHLAARVHQMSNGAADALDDYRAVNILGTERFASQAAAAGVRRFIFLSTVKVNGESTRRGRAFSEKDDPNPGDTYARSKIEAEQRLQDIAHQSRMEVVTIRPPLVYGPGVKANFLTMLHWLAKGIPLPLGAIHNRRSLVALDNLVDFILTCSRHPAAANQTFFVTDGKDLSTTRLLESTAAAMHRPARLFPVPAGILKFGAALLGKQAIARRLCESLQVDSSKARNVLGWRPPISVEAGIRQTVDWYLNTAK